jgi:3-hydroxyacyl-CoA dehydrogenase
VPAVEILGGAATAKKVVGRTIKFMTELGQTPILMKKFVPGFILNRMQAALVREAVDLVGSGVCDVKAVDDAVRDGLGLRWALMGPFGVANTNADGGVRQYFTKYGPAYQDIWATLNPNVRFEDDLIDRLGRETDRMMDATLEAQRAWRDRLVFDVRDLKAAMPLPTRRKRKR